MPRMAVRRGHEWNLNVENLAVPLGKVRLVQRNFFSFLYKA